MVRKEDAATKEVDNLKKENLNYEKELIRVNIELLNRKLEINSSLAQKISFFENSMSRINLLSSGVTDQSQSILEKRFREVEQMWILFSKEKYYDLIKSNNSLGLVSIPMISSSVLNSEQRKGLEETVAALKKLRADILESYSHKKSYELKLLNQLLTSCNSLRSSYFKRLGKSYFFKRLAEPDFFNLLKREILSSPYRILSYFFSKYLEVKETLLRGRQGYAVLFGKVVVFIGLLLGLLSLKFVFARLHRYLDSLMYALISRRRDSFILKKIFSVWNKLKDNFSAILWLSTFLVLEQIPYFQEFHLGISAFEVYFGSIILKSVVTLFLGSVSRLDIGSFISFKKKASQTSDRFKNIFQFYFYTMIFIEATIGRVYLFSIINYVIAVYSIYSVIREASRWEPEFKRYCERKFSGVIVEKFVKFIEYFPKNLRATLLLVFIIVFMIFDLIIVYTEGFELSKKISANLFKRQIENVEASNRDGSQISDEYLELFSLKSLDDDDGYVESSNGIEASIDTEIEEWVAGSSEEHSVVVFGDKGIGKTTLLKKIGSTWSEREGVDVKYAKLPPKLLKKSEIHLFVAELLGQDDSENFDLIQYDQKLEKKTLFILDETQNIFLSQTKGFDAYNALINLINLNTHNIFWVMSFNRYSWLYLDRAFGRIQYFRNIFEIKGWSDSKIKELVMKRHAKADFKLSFDLLISATRSQDEIDRYSSIESKFFKLLWELSRGNPRSALKLWISALSPKSQNSFNVNVPIENELVGIEKVSDDLLFVISHILKHENLLASEIEKTTNLPKGIVRNAIKIGLEKKYFYKDENSRYMVDISSQYGLIRYLRVRNFIYGS